jgi:hypothetical protein
MITILDSVRILKQYGLSLRPLEDVLHRRRHRMIPYEETMNDPTTRWRRRSIIWHLSLRSERCMRLEARRRVHVGDRACLRIRRVGCVRRREHRRRGGTFDQHTFMRRRLHADLREILVMASSRPHPDIVVHSLRVDDREEPAPLGLLATASVVLARERRRADEREQHR